MMRFFKNIYSQQNQQNIPYIVHPGSTITSPLTLDKTTNSSNKRDNKCIRKEIESVPQSQNHMTTNTPTQDFIITYIPQPQLINADQNIQTFRNPCHSKLMRANVLQNF